MNEEENLAVFCSEKDVDENRPLAILAYISILFLAPWLVAPKSKFAQYHANQGALLFIFSIFLFMLARICAEFIWLVPILGNHLYVLNALVPLAILIAAMIYGIINCARGVCKPLPLIGELFILIKYDKKNDSRPD